jgi:two-component system LytT family response regulator
MKQLTAIIVDDERISRRELRRLLEEFPAIEVVGEAASVADAEDLIRRLRPGLVFLDLQLGGETGFELLERIAGPVQVLFVTAHNERSLPALRKHGLPILAKPVNPKQLRKTLAPYLEPPT